MRRRAQRKTQPIEMTQKTKIVKSYDNKIKFKKEWWIAFSLISIFFIVLFLNSYFNIISEDFINPEGDTLTTTFYLSGPDPYYNMRLVEQTTITGKYPYYEDDDPFLNYPLGQSGGRAPLLNMMAIGFSRVLIPFMSESDALGYSMQFIPALFGALVIFPIYFIGKTLFGKKEGLIASLLVAIIPLHIGSGHGSAYGLFDHDSFNLLLFFLTFFFLIKSIKEKNLQKSILFALLSGISLASLNMVWVQARFLFTIIAIYAIVQMIMDIFNNKFNRNVVTSLTIILFAGYLISLPVRYLRIGFETDIQLLMTIGVALFGALYILLEKKKVPWIISLPSIFCTAGITAAILYYIKDVIQIFPFLSPVTRLSEILYGYGAGIYGKKVDLTIAEAGTYGISRTVMSYGPALYWLAWVGLVIITYQYFRKNERRDYLFIAVLFLTNIWLAGIAGRFLNDMVPLIAILAGWIIWYVVAKVDYKQMIRNIRNAGGGFRGIRKGIKIYHILGILFVTVLIILPNAFLALDAAVPSAITKNGTSNMKIDYFGEEHSSAFGSSSYKERYWIDAFNWLNDQDAHIENPIKKPAFISWWDYGFYEATVGGHPTVADNFQDGIPAAANFHTAKSEKEAVAVWIIRLLQGNLADNNGKLSDQVINTLYNHIGENNTNNIILWMENPTQSPSYNTPIGENYDKELSKDLFVGEQWPENAFYHDITGLLDTTLDDEGITWLYHDIQKATEYSIRYYGVEGYDSDIFNIFAFLGDKSLVLHALRSGGSGTNFPNPEDDFIQVKWAGYIVNADGTPGEESEWTAEELNAMSDEERRRIVITDTPSEKKSDYFNTMFYRTYVGDIPEGLQNQVAQLPCWEMRHFSAEYVSVYPYYNTQRGAVVIAKYYEGARINGSVSYLGEPLDSQVVIQKNTPLNIYGISFPIDHDKMNTENGTFSLIAPAGNITLQIRRNIELGINAFVIKTIKFNKSNNSEFDIITEEEAMRSPGTNFIRNINITIEPGSIDGYSYFDTDRNGEYNKSLDNPLKDVLITIVEIEKFDAETGQPSEVGLSKELTTDENGYYKTSNLKPGIYVLYATKNEFTIHENYVFIQPGNNLYNFSQPQYANIEGVVYLDKNENNEYDKGEELDNATVPIIYLKPDDTRKLVNEVKTNKTGRYSFSSLIPGTYILDTVKLNTTTIFPDYSIEETVELKEDESKKFNISLEIAAINIRGTTEFEGKGIEYIPIDFWVDESIANNTAEEAHFTSEDDGTFQVEIKPGYYNITVDFTGTQGSYTFEDKIFTKMGEGFRWFNTSLTKHSITITGSTKYEGKNIGDIKVQFSPDFSIKNNTAEFQQSTSDENGLYVIELLPGTYNVTVDEVINESGVEMRYKFSDVYIAKLAETYDILLTREEV